MAGQVVQRIHLVSRSRDLAESRLLQLALKLPHIGDRKFDFNFFGRSHSSFRRSFVLPSLAVDRRGSAASGSSTISGQPELQLNVGSFTRSFPGTDSSGWPAFFHDASPPTITNALNPC